MFEPNNLWQIATVIFTNCILILNTEMF